MVRHQLNVAFSGELESHDSCFEQLECESPIHVFSSEDQEILFSNFRGVMHQFCWMTAKES
jgi:hypothetical protein